LRALLKKAHTAVRSGGTVAIVEFVPNPDRITPPTAAGFSLIMLATMNVAVIASK